ncbi:MAG: 50S ribosomal protein L6 [Candidatus Woesearchaeota archaeon]
MKTALYEEKIPVLEGVTVTSDKGIVTATGEKGSVSKNLLHSKIGITIEDSHVVIRAKNATKREKMFINTFKAHIQNLMRGAKEGFTYELKICSGHFPMSASVKGTEFELKNFLGENTARKLKIKDGATVSVNGDVITVEAVNKELAGQVSADLEQLTRITDFDRRIFQDGIYIVKKAGKEL